MIRSTILLALTLLLTGPALAQSVAPPAGMESATAPGGTEGRAGPRNEAEAIRSGDAIAVPPSAGGIPVERLPVPPTETPVTPPPPRP